MLAGASSTLAASVSVPLHIARPHAPFVLPDEALALERSIDEERVRHHLPALAHEDRLRDVALAWAKEMAAGEFFSHYDRNGRGLGERLTATGYKFRFAAENIALDSSADDAQIAFMHSPEHASNIFDPHARRVGVAALSIGTRETLYVEDFSD